MHLQSRHVYTSTIHCCLCLFPCRCMRVICADRHQCQCSLQAADVGICGLHQHSVCKLHSLLCGALAHCNSSGTVQQHAVCFTVNDRCQSGRLLFQLHWHDLCCSGSWQLHPLDGHLLCRKRRWHGESGAQGSTSAPVVDGRFWRMSCKVRSGTVCAGWRLAGMRHDT